MAQEKNRKRVLALDIRSAKFGFVVFEGPDTVLDFGVRSCAGPLRATAKKRVLSLLDLYLPYPSGEPIFCG